MTSADILESYFENKGSIRSYDFGIYKVGSSIFNESTCKKSNVYNLKIIIASAITLFFSVLVLLLLMLVIYRTTSDAPLKEEVISLMKTEEETYLLSNHKNESRQSRSGFKIIKNKEEDKTIKKHKSKEIELKNQITPQGLTSDELEQEEENIKKEYENYESKKHSNNNKNKGKLNKIKEAINNNNLKNISINLASAINALEQTETISLKPSPFQNGRQFIKPVSTTQVNAFPDFVKNFNEFSQLESSGNDYHYLKDILQNIFKSQLQITLPRSTTFKPPSSTFTSSLFYKPNIPPPIITLLPVPPLPPVASSGATNPSIFPVVSPSGSVNPLMFLPVSPSAPVNPPMFLPGTPSGNVNPHMFHPVSPSGSVNPTMFHPVSPSGSVSPLMFHPVLPSSSTTPPMFHPVSPSGSVSPPMFHPVSSSSSTNPPMLPLVSPPTYHPPPPTIPTRSSSQSSTLSFFIPTNTTPENLSTTMPIPSNSSSEEIFTTPVNHSQPISTPPSPQSTAPTFSSSSTLASSNTQTQRNLPFYPTPFFQSNTSIPSSTAIQPQRNESNPISFMTNSSQSYDFLGLESTMKTEYVRPVRNMNSKHVKLDITTYAPYTKAVFHPYGKNQSTTSHEEREKKVRRKPLHPIIPYFHERPKSHLPEFPTADTKLKLMLDIFPVTSSTENSDLDEDVYETRSSERRSYSNFDFPEYSTKGSNLINSVENRLRLGVNVYQALP